MGKNRLSDETILITGGAGFIGSHLSKALIDENDVRVIDDLSMGTRTNCPKDATFIEGDVRNRTALARAMDDIDIVFHQAANVSVESSVGDPRRDHQINTSATLNLLELAKNENAKVVYASSAAIYGDPEVIPIPEAHDKAPNSPYGVSKLSSDYYVRLYARLYGVDTTVLRYFNVYGPGQTGGDYSGVISKFKEQAMTGQPITVYGTGSQTRDFIHVNDVVRANLLGASADCPGEAFNIGTGTSVEIIELARLIRDIYDSSSEIVHRSPRPGDINRSEADIRKASERLDFEPEIGISDGLRMLE